MNENVIEWITGDERIAITFSQRKYINRIRRLQRQHPDEVEVHENPDGTIYARLPLSYLKLTAPREMTDEQREAARERFSSVSNTNREKSDPISSSDDFDDQSEG